jgi:16S rRNA (cytosine1402-N4)-methyltransferase
MDHYSVLRRETKQYMALRPQGTYVDSTCGLGGHTGEIARALEAGRVISLDRDAESLQFASQRLADCADRIIFRQSRFSQLGETLQALGCGKVDGILSDLGVSRMQLTEPERGFSLQESGPLDMRMDRGQDLTAGDLVNRASEREIADWIFQFGEERRHPRKIARAIVRGRPIRDTRHLAEVVASVVPRTGKLHPATRVFQALRMVVNDEPGELDALLQQAPEWLAPGGRWVVIAFQSLDDRKVKQAFQALGRSGRATVLTKHVVKPSDEEVRENPASRSAVLRALEMK